MSVSPDDHEHDDLVKKTYYRSRMRESPRRVILHIHIDISDFYLMRQFFEICLRRRHQIIHNVNI